MKKIIKYFLLGVLLVIPFNVKADVFKDGNVSYSVEKYEYNCINGDIWGFNSNFEVVYLNLSGDPHDLWKTTSDNGCKPMEVQEILDYYGSDNYKTNIITEHFEIKNNSAIINKQKYFVFEALVPCDEECVNKGVVPDEGYYEANGSIIIVPDPTMLSTYFVHRPFRYPTSVNEKATFYDDSNRFEIVEENSFNADKILNYKVRVNYDDAFEKVNTVKIDQSKIKSFLDKGYSLLDFLYYNEFTKKGYYILASNNDAKLFDTSGKEMNLYYSVNAVSPSLMVVSYCTSERTCNNAFINNSYKVLYDSFNENEEFLPIKYDDYVTYGLVRDDNGVTLANVYEYRLLSGNKQTYDNKALKFKFSAAIDRVSKVYVGSEELTEEDYSLSSGSTIVTLNKSYLDGLKDGTYKLKIEYIDGASNEATFYINVNPQTGDNIMVSFIIGGISFIALVIVCIYIKKSKLSA